MKINIIDTTLNECNKKFMNLNSFEKIEVVKFISSMEVFQIEFRFNLYDENIRKEIIKITSLDLKNKLSVYSKLNIEDVKASIDCGASAIHISVPIYRSEEDKRIIEENVKRCINYCVESDCEATIGLEDASMANINFILQLSKTAFYEGVKRIRYCDSVGILYPKRILHQIKAIKQIVDVPIEISANDSFGMGVINSMGAIEAGAEYVVSSMMPVNKKIDNCNYFKFIKALYESKGNLVFPNKLKSIYELNKYENKLEQLMSKSFSI